MTLTGSWEVVGEGDRTWEESVKLPSQEMRIIRARHVLRNEV